MLGHPWMRRTNGQGRLSDHEPPRRILAVDIGGSHIKVLASGRTEMRRTSSGPELTPAQMVRAVRKLTSDWRYDVVSIGFPGLAGPRGPVSEPGNLGAGWVGFDFAAAFERPVKIANDAAMQALGSYEGGRMLFLGLGTGLGSALIAERAIVPVELSHLPWRGPKLTLGAVLGKEGLKRFGKKYWRRTLVTVAAQLNKAFLADYVVIGGGNAKYLRELPHGIRIGNNLTAFRGGFRLWGVEDVPVLTGGETEPVPESSPPAEWRLL